MCHDQKSLTEALLKACIISYTCTQWLLTDPAARHPCIFSTILLLLVLLRNLCSIFLRQCFVPTSELNSLKAFTSHILKVFLGGALFIACKEEEFKLFLIEITSDFLKQDGRHNLLSTRMLGRNSGRNGGAEWILAPVIHLDDYGRPVDSNRTNFMLVNHNSKLSCNITKPLDNGEALNALHTAIGNFMPDNATSCLACMAAFCMGASYEQIIDACGQIGVLFLFGDFGSCKSKASLCALLMFGANETHTFNNQTTASYLFEAGTHSAFPIVIDDINKNSNSVWEELIVDIYNNTPRGTHSLWSGKVSNYSYLVLKLAF